MGQKTVLFWFWSARDAQHQADISRLSELAGTAEAAGLHVVACESSPADGTEALQVWRENGGGNVASVVDGGKLKKHVKGSPQGQMVIFSKGERKPMYVGTGSGPWLTGMAWEILNASDAKTVQKAEGGDTQPITGSYDSLKKAASKLNTTLLDPAGRGMSPVVGAVAAPGWRCRCAWT